jgi:hypothetical protein
LTGGTIGHRAHCSTLEGHHRCLRNFG